MSLLPSPWTCVAAGEPASSNVSSHSHNHLIIFMDNIYLEGTFLAGKRNKTEGTFLAGKRNITELEGTFLAGKRNKPKGAFLAVKRNKTELEGTFLCPCRKKELSRYLPAIQGLCELFQPSGASGSCLTLRPIFTRAGLPLRGSGPDNVWQSGSYAQIFPTQTTYKQDICTYTRKKTNHDTEAQCG